MREDKEILKQFGEDSIDLILKEVEAQDRRATGRAEKGLTITVGDTELQIIDTAGYAEWGWEYGRPPGKYPPFNPDTGTFDGIVEWMIAKGLITGGEKESEIKSRAFLIARSIANHGTLLFAQGGNEDGSGVLSNAINTARVEALGETFADKYAIQITSELVRTLQETNSYATA